MIHIGMFWLRLVGGVCAVWLLAACGAAPSGSTENPTPETAATATPAGAELVGTAWRLVEYGPAEASVAAMTEPAVTATFETDGRFGGSGGCNSYGGTWTLDGQSLTLGEVVSTLMACADNAAMQQETAYFAALRSVTTSQVAGDELTLDYAGGRLRFARTQPAGS